LKRIYKSLPVYHLLQQAEADHWLKGIPYHHVGDSLWTFQLGQIYGLRIDSIFSLQLKENFITQNLIF